LGFKVTIPEATAGSDELLYHYYDDRYPKAMISDRSNPTYVLIFESTLRFLKGFMQRGRDWDWV
jgi:hypothetical protein